MNMHLRISIRLTTKQYTRSHDDRVIRINELSPTKNEHVTTSRHA